VIRAVRAVGLMLVALSFAALPPALAEPILSESVLVAHLRCYPDHLDRSLWWYARDRVALSRSDGSPAFSFQRFRYKGSAATRDSEVLWARGVLGFTVELDAAPSEVDDAERALSRRLRRRVTLRQLPIEAIESLLLYATAGPEADSGALPPGEWTGEPGVWHVRTFQLGLDPRTTDLLWRAFHQEGLALSLQYSLVARGLPERPPAGTDAPPESARSVVAAGTQPIRVAPDDCPSCFASLEIDARIPAGYTSLEIFCYDFESAAAPSDLARVLVEIRARTATGAEALERVRFLASGPTRMAVHFPVAVEIDGGYELRTVRLFADGHAEEEAWRRFSSWIGIQDVTRYVVAEGRRTLDPRMLY